MFKSTKKIISIILSIMMVISGFSALAITAGAATTDEADLEAFLEEAPLLACIIIGDADLDGDPNVKDATLIQMYIANYAKFNGYQMIAADTDRNNDINIRDATNVQLHAAGYNTDYDDNYVGTAIYIGEDETPPVTDETTEVPTDPTVTGATETDPTPPPSTEPNPTTEPKPTTAPTTEPKPTTTPTTEPVPTTGSTDPPVLETKYIITGGRNLFGSNWDRTDENNKMTYNASTGRYEWTAENVANNLYEYKIVKVINDDYNGGEVVASDSSVATGNITFTVATTGTKITIWFKPETGQYGQELVEPTFVVAGSQSLCGSAWNKADQNNKMTYNSSTGRYEKGYQLNKGTYEYKIARNGTEFVFTDTSVDTGNIKFTVNVDNTNVTIWYKPNSNEHGREVVEPPTTSPTTVPSKSIEEVAQEVLDGLWGNGDERRKNLSDAGYDPDEVQKKVNELLEQQSTTAPTTQSSSIYPTEATPMMGIDISYYQGNVNFTSVKNAGVKFVILRAGYGTSTKDSKFETYYSGAKAVGLKVGAYWYSYASTTAAAVTEANKCLSVLSGKKFEFPIYFDLEESSQFAKGVTFCDTLVNNFCSTLEAKGYYTGLYMSRSHLQTYVSSSVRSKYALWVAEYGSKCNYTGHGMWQYTGSGSISGISGYVDRDWGYVDYSGIIRNQGFNGYPGVSSGGSSGGDSGGSSTPSKSIEEVAQEVLDGLWGNGDERRERLAAAGYDPDEVQKKVNELLYGSSSSTKTHTVVSGDTLSAIASKYGTTVDAIIAANKSKYPNISASYIQVGWVLTIP